MTAPGKPLDLDGMEKALQKALEDYRTPGRWSSGCVVGADHVEAVLALIQTQRELERDAARWRALMTLPRIRMWGSAGVDHETGERNDGTYVHFGAEFWTDMGADYDRSKDPQNTREWGCHALTACADAMIERATKALGEQPL